MKNFLLLTKPKIDFFFQFPVQFGRLVPLAIAGLGGQTATYKLKNMLHNRRIKTWSSFAYNATFSDR